MPHDSTMVPSVTKRFATAVSSHELEDISIQPICKECGQFMLSKVNIPHYGAWDFPLSKAEHVKRMLFVLSAGASLYEQGLDALSATYMEIQSQLSASRSAIDTCNGIVNSDIFSSAQTSPKATCPETSRTTDPCGCGKQAPGHVESHITSDFALTSSESVCCELCSHSSKLTPSLPCIACIKKAEHREDISSLIGQVRMWVRQVQRDSGDLPNAWNGIDSEHRGAIHRFLTMQIAKRSMYRSRAKELLVKLQLPSAEEVDPAASLTKEVDLIATVPSEVFKVRACLDELIDEQALNLIDVWSSLHSERQRVVHGFLTRESQTGSMRSKQAQDILAMLPPIEEDAAQVVAGDHKLHSGRVSRYCTWTARLSGIFDRWHNSPHPRP